MKTFLQTLCLLALLATAGNVAASEGMRNLGKVTGGDITNARSIIEKRCTTCHGAERIDAAFGTGRNMADIQKLMEQRGAKLEVNEREVLGIYWNQNPLKMD